jgi:hypothetical protein
MTKHNKKRKFSFLKFENTKEQSEVVIRRRTDNTTTNRKRTKNLTGPRNTKQKTKA